MIVAAIESGATYKIAAEAAGITERTLYAWLEAGRKGESEDGLRLLHDIKKAQANGALFALREITRHGKKSWQAHAWMLERRHGYVRRDEIRHDVDAKVSGDLSKLSTEELERLDELAQRLASDDAE